jgi:hypothetical protein
VKLESDEIFEMSVFEQDCAENKNGERCSVTWYTGFVIIIPQSSVQNLRGLVCNLIYKIGRG